MEHYQRLEHAPQSHHIFHALRVIEAAFAQQPVLGRSMRPGEDPVRLGQVPELGWPAGTIDSFGPSASGHPALINRFFGFFGPHGPLPLHLTEYARDRQLNAHDPTMVAFLNLFTHRFMSLLYRAYVTGRPAADFDRGPGGRIEGRLAALAGIGSPAFRRRDGLPDLMRLRFAGLMMSGPRHADGLSALLRSFFSVPVQVEEFVPDRLELEPGDRWQLGRPAALGRETSLGTSVRSRSARFRLRIGPMALSDYERLLPGQAGLSRLVALVRSYAGDTLAWDVNLVLRADQVPAARLGGTARLGQTSWLAGRAPAQPADEFYLEPGLHSAGAGGAGVFQ